MDISFAFRIKFEKKSSFAYSDVIKSMISDVFLKY